MRDVVFLVGEQSLVSETDDVGGCVGQAVTRMNVFACNFPTILIDQYGFVVRESDDEDKGAGSR